jgi:hypothetical protein
MRFTTRVMLLAAIVRAQSLKYLWTLGSAAPAALEAWFNAPSPLFCH